MHDIERELIEITGYKVQRKFTDRQDYLKSLFNAVQKLTDDDFDNLSDDAAAWANACVEAHNSKRDGDIPDFDEAEPEDSEEVEVEEPDEDSGDEEAEDAPEDESDEEPSEEDDNGADDEAEESEPEEESEKDHPQLEMELADEEPEKKPKAKAKAKSEPKPVKKADTKKEVAKKKVVVRKPKASEDDDEDVILDKWGCMEGSKNSKALALFEKGATAAEVKAAIGGTYYNILGKMTKQGHKVTKTGSLIKLTHMSDKESKVSLPKKTKK